MPFRALQNIAAVNLTCGLCIACFPMAHESCLALAIAISLIVCIGGSVGGPSRKRPLPAGVFRHLEVALPRGALSGLSVVSARERSGSASPEPADATEE